MGQGTLGSGNEVIIYFLFIRILLFKDVDLNNFYCLKDRVPALEHNLTLCANFSLSIIIFKNGVKHEKGIISVKGNVFYEDRVVY
ncbi:hypothetical protein OKW21_003338 [Catalinimonas alkaloidigena]|uniref:hypothetical protein n=1 Tax=Catalinimonas alkaloidigena TaxID=1075417 RepID=UPI00240529FF|nr:hypothetical protein [Catalinimonas alkaloidigena]MDF9798075.1 hypothetical protein [Catalinimonas alkaloidigena]